MAERLFSLSIVELEILVIVAGADRELLGLSACKLSESGAGLCPSAEVASEPVWRESELGGDGLLALRFWDVEDAGDEHSD